MTERAHEMHSAVKSSPNDIESLLGGRLRGTRTNREREHHCLLAQDEDDVEKGTQKEFATTHSIQQTKPIVIAFCLKEANDSRTKCDIVGDLTQQTVRQEAQNRISKVIRTPQSSGH